MCTRILWNDNPFAVVASRCMDWEVSDEPDLWFLPRGLTRDGHGDGTSLSWTSRYSSLATSMWQVGTVDGINETGLAVHALYLDAEYEPHDRRPSVSNAMWAQWVLDTFSTVAEVVEHLADVRISSLEMRGAQLGVHYALEDASGDSAVIEPVGGKLVVHHGREYTVMANSPSLDEQLQNLTRYAPFGGDLPLPGDISSTDRFVRANYFLHHLPTPNDYIEAVAGVFQLIQNVAVPYGAPYSDGQGVYPTWWQAVVDATNRTYYFHSTRSPNTFWVELADLLPGDQVLRLNPRDPALTGNAAALMVPGALTY